MAAFLRTRSKSRESQKSPEDTPPPIFTQTENEQKYEHDQAKRQFNEKYEENHNENERRRDRTEYDTASLISDESNHLLNSDPLTAAVGQIFAAINSLNLDGKSKQKFFNIEEFAEKIRKNNTYMQKEKHALEQNLNQCVKNEVSTYKKEQLDMDLNFHKLNPLIRVPDYFSPVETLTTHDKKSNLYKVLPFGKQKFSGKNDSVKISEFLLNLNFIQQKYKLSLSEFTQALQFSTTGPTFEVVSQSIDAGEPISAIYNKLMVLYDSSQTPFDAKRDLLYYKANKNQNLMSLTSEIQRLANISSKMTQNLAIRKSNADAEACQTFIHCLPPESQTLALNQFNVLCTKTGAPPQFINFILFLHPYQTSIEADIKKNGENSGKFSKQNGSYKSPAYSRTIYNINSHSNTRFNKSAQSNFQSRSPGQGSRHNKIDYMNKRKCLLCGGTNHEASNNCYKMRDSNGKQVKTTPVQKACGFCEKNYNERLFHQEKYCFRQNPRRPISNRFNKNS
jgi:hypothetical protein